MRVEQPCSNSLVILLEALLLQVLQSHSYRAGMGGCCHQPGMNATVLVLVAYSMILEGSSAYRILPFRFARPPGLTATGVLVLQP